MVYIFITVTCGEQLKKCYSPISRKPNKSYILRQFLTTKCSYQTNIVQLSRNVCAVLYGAVVTFPLTELCPAVHCTSLLTTRTKGTCASHQQRNRCETMIIVPSSDIHSTDSQRAHQLHVHAITDWLCTLWYSQRITFGATWAPHQQLVLNFPPFWVRSTLLPDPTSPNVVLRPTLHRRLFFRAERELFSMGAIIVVVRVPGNWKKHFCHVYNQISERQFVHYQFLFIYFQKTSSDTTHLIKWIGITCMRRRKAYLHSEQYFRCNHFMCINGAKFFIWNLQFNMPSNTGMKIQVRRIRGQKLPEFIDDLYLSSCLEFKYSQHWVMYPKGSSQCRVHVALRVVLDLLLQSSCEDIFIKLSPDIQIAWSALSCMWSQHVLVGIPP